jgi:opacity protein-like surface antigen
VFGVSGDYNSIKETSVSDAYTGSGSYSSFGYSNNGITGNPFCSNVNYSSCNAEGNNQTSGSTQSSTSWLTTVRGKIGVANDRFMAYVNGGPAWGRVSLSTTSSYQDSEQYAALACIAGQAGCTAAANAVQVDGTSATWNASKTQTKTGLALGAGFNYAVTDNIYFNIDTTYYNLGKMSVTAAGVASQSCTVGGGSGGAYAACQVVAGPIAVANYTVSKTYQGAFATMGVGYKF